MATVPDKGLNMIVLSPLPGGFPGVFPLTSQNRLALDRVKLKGSHVATGPDKGLNMI